MRRADVELGKGLTISEVCRAIEVTEQTYYRWHQKCGGMGPQLVHEMKTLQKENQRLEKIVAGVRRLAFRWPRFGYRRAALLRKEELACERQAGASAVKGPRAADSPKSP